MDTVKPHYTYAQAPAEEELPEPKSDEINVSKAIGWKDSSLCRIGVGESAAPTVREW